MSRIFVVGIGNLLQKDDGLGVKVVRALAEPLKEHDIASLVGETDVPCCLAEMRTDDFLILVDAMASGGEAGKVERIALDEALHGRGFSSSPHEHSLLDAIYLTYPQIQGCLIAIEGADFDCGLALSPLLQQRFQVICEAVLQHILKQKGVACQK